MVLGVGVDQVYIPEFRRLAPSLDDAFVTHTFTAREQSYAQAKPDPVETLAGLFAVKEAVTKAISPLVAGHEFDMRTIETLHREDGSPYVAHVPPLSNALDACGIRSIHISISTEHDYASAIAIAEN